MNCVEHGVQDVRDFFPSKQVLLSCGCRRDCFLRTTEEIREFDKADHERTVRRELVGHSRPTAGGHVHQYVEDIATEAA